MSEQTKFRYVAVHNADPGFETTEDVKKWIARREFPENYSIAKITFCHTVWPAKERLITELRKFEIDEAYRKGVSSERNRLTKLLGLQRPILIEES